MCCIFSVCCFLKKIYALKTTLLNYVFFSFYILKYIDDRHWYYFCCRFWHAWHLYMYLPIIVLKPDWWQQTRGSHQSVGACRSHKAGSIFAVLEWDQISKGDQWVWKNTWWVTVNPSGTRWLLYRIHKSVTQREQRLKIIAQI